MGLSTQLIERFRKHGPNRAEFDNGQFVSDVNDMVLAAPGVTYGDEDANARTVTIQIKDWIGNNLRQVVPVEWIVTDATGGAPAASAPSGGVAVSTGVAVVEYTADKYGLAQTNSSGVLVLTITETTEKSFYVTLIIRGKVFLLPVLAFAS